MKNLALKVFVVLRNLFFDEVGNPIYFYLREKLNTQDDPFDEYIADELTKQLPAMGATCQKSSGPLISPDMVVFRLGIQTNSEKVENNPDEIIGIEVKKLERGANGKVARSTGLDFNSTPPCGSIRIYDSNDKELIIKGFYLFACLEQDMSGNYFVSAMTLCDGSILNDDFDLYMQITGSREKGINLGTYGDGANRNRPMLLFSNPLGAEYLDNKITLISSLDLSQEHGNIELAWNFIRTGVDGVARSFYVYMDCRDLDAGYVASVINEPFPTPKKRVTETQGRGKFRLEPRE